MERGLRERVPVLEKVAVVPKQAEAERDQASQRAREPGSAGPKALETAVRAATNRQPLAIASIEGIRLRWTKSDRVQATGLSKFE